MLPLSHGLFKCLDPNSHTHEVRFFFLLKWPLEKHSSIHVLTPVASASLGQKSGRHSPLALYIRVRAVRIWGVGGGEKCVCVCEREGERGILLKRGTESSFSITQLLTPEM